MRPSSTTTPTDTSGRSTAATDANSGDAFSLRSVILRQDTILLGVLIIMVVFFTVMNPLFFSGHAFANILQDWAPVMLLAIGQTYVIISAGIDLSVGSTLGLAGVSCALTIRALTEMEMTPGLAIGAGMLVAVAVGALVGFVNGLLVVKVRLAPFIATLATMGAGAGLTLVLTRGVQVAGGPREVVALGSTKFLEVLTVPLVAVLIVLAIGWIVLEQTRFGRWTYAVGSNSFAARGAGITVDRHLVKVYMLSGVMAGLAGIFVYLRLGSGSPTSGQGYELTAIAAAVIGGTSLVGGTGRMSGTVLGALITTAVLSGLILIGVAPYWQQVVVGVLIAVAVGLQQASAARLRSGVKHG